MAHTPVGHDTYGQAGEPGAGVISSSARFALIAAFVVANSAYGQDVEPTVWVTKPSILDCNPKALRKGQPLILTMGPRHGQELAIRRVADGKWYFLVVGSPPPEMRSIMTPEQFSKAMRLELPADVTGLDWSYKGVQSRIFTKPGQYVVYSSDTLESEQGGFHCRVSYRG